MCIHVSRDRPRLGVGGESILRVVVPQGAVLVREIRPGLRRGDGFGVMMNLDLGGHRHSAAVHFGLMSALFGRILVPRTQLVWSGMGLTALEQMVAKRVALAAGLAAFDLAHCGLGDEFGFEAYTFVD